MGQVEQLIIEYLFNHPDQLIQWIKDGINKDYKTVHDATMRLLKKKYIVSEKPVKTGKGIEEKSYRLNEKGISWAIAYGIGDISKIHVDYWESDIIKAMQMLRRTVGEKRFSRFMQKAFRLFLVLLEEEEHGKKISSQEALDYVVGAMCGWLLIRVDERKFPLDSVPKSFGVDNAKFIIEQLNKQKRELGVIDSEK